MVVDLGCFGMLSQFGRGWVIGRLVRVEATYQSTLAELAHAHLTIEHMRSAKSEEDVCTALPFTLVTMTGTISNDGPYLVYVT